MPSDLEHGGEEQGKRYCSIMHCSSLRKRVTIFIDPRSRSRFILGIIFAIAFVLSGYHMVESITAHSSKLKVNTLPKSGVFGAKSTMHPKKQIALESSGHPNKTTEAADTARREAYLQGPIRLVEQHGPDEGAIEIVYALPDPAVGTKAALLVAHGCIHSAGDFFPASPACRACRGMPVEAGIARSALEKGFAVIAVTSMDRSL